ncbi:NADPH-dependent curcumin reductase CurA [Rhodococcus sp. 27YEA15]|uniref:zinc-binding dehydrogenase n=1 Tax=Rhodococcus sp. 27YEA15 TaxID=3156259 RepID=UPI003C7B2BCF
MAPENPAIFLNEYALGGQLTKDHFSVRNHPLPTIPDGGLLVETTHLSVDPYMRGCMTGLGNYYMPQFALDTPLHSVGIGTVLDTRNPDFTPGDLVLGALDWSTQFVSDPTTAHLRRPGGALRRIEPNTLSPSHHLGALGMTGITAFFGILAVAKPRSGETLLISSAAGGVGSIAGQIAKLRGARVIGLTSTKEKRDALLEQLGFDAALDYRSPTLTDELHELMPTGPDIYFDNVGGTLSQTIMSTMHQPARIVECGQISTYDNNDGGWMVDVRPIHGRGLRFEGFNPKLYADFHPAAVAQLTHWIHTKALHPLETEHHGFDSIVPAYLDMMQGGNIGKTIINIEH